MTTVFVSTDKHAQHIAIIDGVRYYRSYAKGRTPVDRRAYYKHYRTAKRRDRATTGADTGASADTVDTSTDVVFDTHV